MKYLLLLCYFNFGIWCSIFCQTQHSRFPFGRYLCVKPYILKAKVVRINEFNFLLEIEKWIKPVQNNKQKLKVTYNFSLKNSSEAKKKLALVSSKSYVFLITKKTKGYNRLLLHENARFKVLGDSLCIGSYFLSGLNYNHDLIFEENPLNDEIMPTGFMISIHDFIKLVEDVNNAFVVDESTGIHRFVGTTSTDPFTLAVIEEFNNSLCQGKPINMTD